MKKHLLLIFGAWIIGTMGFGQELIQNGDFELPDDGRKYNSVDSIDIWKTDDVEANSGRDFVEGNGVGWHWDGTGSIYQVVGTVPSIATRYAVSFEATCMYSYWGGDYITDVYVIFSAFPGTDTAARVPIDSLTFTVSCIQADWFTWVTKTGEYLLQGDNEHAGENLVIEIEIFDSRNFTYGESETYLYYDNVSVTSTATAVKDLGNSAFKVFSTPDVIRISNDKAIESTVIFDISGKRVMEARPNSSEVTLNVGHLNRGIYIVNVFTNGQQVTRKVVL